MFESDIDVCCYGNVIKSRYNIEEDEYSVEKIDATMMRVLLVDLNINFDMDERTMQIMTQKHNSEKMNEYLNLSDKISEDICKTLVFINFYFEHYNFSEDEKKGFAALQELIQKYQSVLTDLNLSHVNLDNLINLEECRNFEASVGITFAGYRSKYAYILLTSHIKENSVKKLKQCLQNKGFKFIDTTVSCTGLVKTDNEYK
ncbi:uncharacterized protein LOC114946529 [Nylanderia fulva]|uniref:uncharacterized protein LOC114946529 n=1 Tax=Nylanderia fulva TaxID=613905 RepID=UPI0010FBB4F0|nr:uncharacterized protein LOC114946529 [Nylanderia fulva]